MGSNGKVAMASNGDETVAAVEDGGGKSIRSGGEFEVVLECREAR